jgi:hypothetical protein
MFAGNTAALSSALTNATSYWQSTTDPKFTPTIFLASDADINPPANFYYAMAGDVIIYGPLMNSQTGSSSRPVELDLGQRKGTIHLPISASIFFQNLVGTC